MDVEGSRTAPGITKWFWVTIEGYLSYFLPKFEDFVPTGLGSGALYIHARTYTLYPVDDFAPLDQGSPIIFKMILSNMYPVDKEDGAMVCTSLGSLLRPLFYFLCSILLIHIHDPFGGAYIINIELSATKAFIAFMIRRFLACFENQIKNLI